MLRPRKNTLQVRGTAYINSELSADDPGGAGARLHHPGLVAARDGRLEALRELLGGGWEVFSAGSLDRNGASALDWAAGGGHLACVELLAPHAHGVRQPTACTRRSALERPLNGCIAQHEYAGGRWRPAGAMARDRPTGRRGTEGRRYCVACWSWGWRAAPTRGPRTGRRC